MRNNNPYLIEREERVYDVRKMSAEALTELEMQLQDDITAIRDQIEAAQARRWDTGVYANADWFRRAKTARSIKARQHDTVKRARKAAEVAERRAAVGQFGRLFMDAARAILSREEFDRVLAAAAAMQATMVGGSHETLSE